VEYEFFDFEEPSRDAREFARQIRLVFSDAPTPFVSWTWERQYGHGPDSFLFLSSQSTITHQQRFKDH